MNKQLVITVMAAALLAASGFASADNGRRGHHGPYHGGHYSYGYERHRVRRHYRPRHHYRPVYHHGYHHGYRHGHHHGRHELRKGLKIAAGAILLGSVIHAASDHRRDRVVVRKRVTRAPSHDDGYFVRDQEGECYEVTTNRDGEEVWTWVDQSYCN